MATRREIRSDIILRLTKGKPSDDFEIDNRQIDFWIDQVRAAIITAQLTQDYKYGVEAFLTSADNVAIEKDTINKTPGNNVRYFSELPSNVVKLRNDIGVYYVETTGGTRILRMKPSDKDLLCKLKFAKPDQAHMGYYRVNDRIYYMGPSTNFLDSSSVNMLLIQSDTSSVGDRDDFPFPEGLLPMLIEEAEQIGRRELELPQDLANDGAYE